MTNTNPLLDFARKVELSIKLPSNGNWYPEGMIDYTMTGEVEVYPMLPKDELMLMNPDALLSGQANVNLIKSCVPAIHQPEKLLYPDLNVLLLAIQKATYGDKLTMQVVCPECLKKMDAMIEKIEDENLKLKDEDKVDVKSFIAEKEKEGEFISHTQENIFSIEEILNRITYLEPEYIYHTENGLDIYLKPNSLEDKAKYGLMLFNEEKIIKSFKDYSFEKSLSDDEEKKIMNVTNNAYLKINEIGNELIARNIIKVKLPDGTFVDNYDLIHDFILNSSSNVVMDINTKIKELNDVGVAPKLEYECECCGHKWEEKFFGYNQSDFFGTGS